MEGQSQPGWWLRPWHLQKSPKKAVVLAWFSLNQPICSSAVGLASEHRCRDPSRAKPFFMLGGCRWTSGPFDLEACASIGPCDLCRGRLLASLAHFR